MIIEITVIKYNRNVLTYHNETRSKMYTCVYKLRVSSIDFMGSSITINLILLQSKDLERELTITSSIQVYLVLLGQQEWIFGVESRDRSPMYSTSLIPGSP